MVVPPKASNMCVLSVGEPMVWGSPYLGNLHIYDLEQKGKQSLFYCFATGVQTANFYYWVIPCNCLTQKNVYVSTYVHCLAHVSLHLFLCKYATCIFDTIVEDSPT